MPAAIPLAIMAAGAVAKGVGEHKKSKKAEKAALDQANLNNERLSGSRMAQQKALAGLEGSGWNPYGVNTLGSSDSSTSTTSGRRDFYSKENPFTTPEYQKLDNLVRGVLENRLSRGSSLPPGYEQNAIRKINAASAGGEAAARNIAARRGLGGAQTFGLNTAPQAARAGQIADLRGSVPLLERDLMNQDIGLEGSRQAQFGTGQEKRGHETSRFTTDASGTASRQVGPDINSLMSLLMPPGTQQSTLSPYSGWGNALSTGGSAAMQIGGAMAGGGGGGGSAMSIPKSGVCPDGQVRIGC